MTPTRSRTSTRRRSRFALTLVGLLATFALAATACGTSKKTDEAGSGGLGTRSTDASLDATTDTSGLGGGTGSVSVAGGTDGAAAGTGGNAGGATDNPRAGRSTDGARSNGPSGAGQAVRPDAQPSDPGSPYCVLANVVSPSLYDPVDPESAPLLRELQSVSPPELVDVFRYLLDINKQASDLDPDSAVQVDALDSVLRSTDFKDAGQAVDNYTYAACGFEMYL